jgi:CubicO group peptidase (beta-lactamase class C family)
MDRILTRQVEKHSTPSVQYAIFDGQRMIHEFRYGWADIKKRKKTDENTTYNAYSVTKTFTAVAVLQLAERKKIGLDRPVSEYLPDFPYPPGITIRQLLSHSAGIPNPIPLSWIHPAGEHRSFDRDGFFQRIFRKHDRVKSEPNEKYAYSNLGYVLLGQLIEKVSGQSYEEYIREQILQPLAIRPGELGFEIADAERHARGYHKRFSFSYLLLGFFLDKAKYLKRTEGRWQAFEDFYVNGASYGGLIGTADAFVKYIRELLRADGRLLSAASKQTLFAENRSRGGKATGMCLSWFKGQLKGNRFYAHAGGGGGYYCELRIYPDLGLGSVVMFNRTGMSDERFLSRLDTYFIGQK